jgi:hypothetical protein
LIDTSILDTLKTEKCLRITYFDLSYVGWSNEDLLDGMDGSEAGVRSLPLGLAKLPEPAFDALIDLLEAADGRANREMMSTIRNNKLLPDVSLHLSDVGLFGPKLAALRPKTTESDSSHATPPAWLRLRSL